MGSSLLIPFEHFPAEQELISNMILAYGELEFTMMDILALALNDMHASVRTLYQLRSESNRQAVVEAIAQPAFDRAGLGGQFTEAMIAVGHCKTFRNQFAHCNWIPMDGVLHFTQLEETAKSKGPVCTVRNIPITLSLLQGQWDYFEYTSHVLLWLSGELRVKNGQPIPGGHAIPKPLRISPPKRDSRGEAHPHR